MPILSLAEGKWTYLDVGIVRNRFVLHVERDPSRSTQPRIRMYTTQAGYYNTRGFEGRVQWNRHPDQSATNEGGVWEYELIHDRNEGFFEIKTYTPRPGTHYLGVKRHKRGAYEVVEYLNADACIRGYHGNGRFGDIIRVISESPQGVEERRDVGKPGPRDRFERILDFGVKGADPEPSFEELLDKVSVTQTRKRQEIPEADLLAALEKVDAPSERPKVDESFDDFLASIFK